MEEGKQEIDCTCASKMANRKSSDKIVKKVHFEYEYPPPPPPPTQPEIGRYKPIPVKTYDEMTDEELLVMFSGGKVSIGMDKIPKIRKYYFQLEQSEGFDLDENPGVHLPPASITKVDCCSKCDPQNYDKYMTLSQYAIDETYNQDKKTEFKVLEVHSVNWTYSGGESFLMTFTAAEDAAGGIDRAASKKTFQARVCTWQTYGKPEEKFRRVGSCRVKG